MYRRKEKMTPGFYRVYLQLWVLYIIHNPFIWAYRSAVTVRTWSTLLLENLSMIARFISEMEVNCMEYHFVFRVCTISPLSPPPNSVFSLVPPFVMRSVLVGWGFLGSKMADLRERENGVWGRKRGNRANPGYLDLRCKLTTTHNCVRFS